MVIGMLTGRVKVVRFSNFFAPPERPSWRSLLDLRDNVIIRSLWVRLRPLYAVFASPQLGNTPFRLASSTTYTLLALVPVHAAAS